MFALPISMPRFNKSINFYQNRPEIVIFAKFLSPGALPSDPLPSGGWGFWPPNHQPLAAGGFAYTETVPHSGFLDTRRILQYYNWNKCNFRSKHNIAQLTEKNWKTQRNYSATNFEDIGTQCNFRNCGGFGSCALPTSNIHKNRIIEQKFIFLLLKNQTSNHKKCTMAI